MREEEREVLASVGTYGNAKGEGEEKGGGTATSSSTRSSSSTCPRNTRRFASAVLQPFSPRKGQVCGGHSEVAFALHGVPDAPPRPRRLLCRGGAGWGAGRHRIDEVHPVLPHARRASLRGPSAARRRHLRAHLERAPPRAAGALRRAPPALAPAEARQARGPTPRKRGRARGGVGAWGRGG